MILLELHDSKCEELRFCFTRFDHASLYESIVVGGNHLEVVTHPEILGLTISSDIKRNKHILKSHQEGKQAV